MYIELLGQEVPVSKKKKKIQSIYCRFRIEFCEGATSQPKKGLWQHPAHTMNFYEFQLPYNNVLAQKTRGEESCLYFHLQQNTNHMKVEANTIDTKVSGEK